MRIRKGTRLLVSSWAAPSLTVGKSPQVVGLVLGCTITNSREEQLRSRTTELSSWFGHLELNSTFMNKMLCNCSPFSLSFQYGQWTWMCKTQNEAEHFPQLSSFWPTPWTQGSSSWRVSLQLQLPCHFIYVFCQMSLFSPDHPAQGNPGPSRLCPFPCSVSISQLYYFLHDNTLRFSSWSVPHTDHEHDGNRDYCTLCLLLCSLPLECAQRAAVQ